MNKPRGRPFQPGNTYGRGRPKGSRNRSKTPGQDLLDKYEPQLFAKCISLAMQGEIRALLKCLDGLSPRQRGARIRVPLLPIRTSQDVDLSAETIMQAVSRGKLTPSEGQALMQILESRAQILRDVDLLQRVERMEQEMGTQGWRGAA